MKKDGEKILGFLEEITINYFLLGATTIRVALEIVTERLGDGQGMGREKTFVHDEVYVLIRENPEKRILVDNLLMT